MKEFPNLEPLTADQFRGLSRKVVDFVCGFWFDDPNLRGGKGMRALAKKHVIYVNRRTNERRRSRDLVLFKSSANSLSDSGVATRSVVVKEDIGLED